MKSELLIECSNYAAAKRLKNFLSKNLTNEEKNVLLIAENKRFHLIFQSEKARDIAADIIELAAKTGKIKVKLTRLLTREYLVQK